MQRIRYEAARLELMLNAARPAPGMPGDPGPCHQHPPIERRSQNRLWPMSEAPALRSCRLERVMTNDHNRAQTYSPADIFTKNAGNALGRYGAFSTDSVGRCLPEPECVEAGPGEADDQEIR